MDTPMNEPSHSLMVTKVAYLLERSFCINLLFIKNKEILLKQK